MSWAYYVDVSTSTVSLVKDLLNCVFFGVVTVVTVLTYLRAKHSILQPLRTEIFKLQVQELSSILAFFVGKDEVGLWDEFDFDALVFANAARVLDEYAYACFGVKPDFESRPYNHRDCPVSIMRAERLRPLDGYLQPEEAATDAITDRNSRCAQWAETTTDEISLPRKFVDTTQMLKGKLESPILPASVCNLLEQFVDAVNSNADAVRELLDDCRRELPEKYPSIELFRRATADWMHARFVDKAVHLKPASDELVRHIRSYYAPDRLQHL